MADPRAGPTPMLIAVAMVMTLTSLYRHLNSDRVAFPESEHG